MMECGEFGDDRRVVDARIVDPGLDYALLVACRPEAPEWGARSAVSLVWMVMCVVMVKR